MSAERRLALREAVCRLVGHRPEGTGRPSGVKSCRRCYDVLPDAR